MHFEEILRRLIEESDLTQKQVANDLHIPASTLGGYVQGTSEPDFETLKLLAEYFQVSTDYLLNYAPEKGQPFLEKEMLRIFRNLSDEHQGLYIEIGRTLLKEKEKAKASLPREEG